MANRSTMPQFQRKVERFYRTMPQRIYIGLEKATVVVKQEVERRLSGITLHTRSGDLLSALGTEVKKQQGKQHGYVYIHNRQKYKALTHEEGKTITPRRKPYLVFSIGGKVIKTKSVTIPARPFMKPAARAKRKRVAQIILKEIVRPFK